MSRPTSAAVTLVVAAAYRRTMRNNLKIFGVLLALLAIPSVAYAASGACDDCGCPFCDD